MFTVLTAILLIITKVECKASISNVQHAHIKYYANITMKGCGVGQATPRATDNTCFPFHNKTYSPIQNGRDVKPGEVPWMAYISVNKSNDPKHLEIGSGIVINQRWILTAAHLIDCDSCKVNQIKVYPGVYDKRNLTSQQLYYHEFIAVHPMYRDEENAHDIGLIKLNRDIAFESHPFNRMVNGICLPEVNATNNKVEYANVAGCGYLDENRPNKGPVQIGWVQIERERNNDGDEHGLNVVMCRVPSKSGTGTCAGDSGGPLYQYSDGQAVLIGVITESDSLRESDMCMSPLPESRQYATRVSYHVPWIIDVIKKH